MIVVDASAIVGILAEEGDSQDLASRLQSSPAGSGLRQASAVTIWEAASALARIWRIQPTEAFSEVREFLDVGLIEPIAPDMTITALAIEAAERYGMGPGRPGVLNLGDCFSYATAKHLKARLLFKGDDFGRTDIKPA